MSAYTPFPLASAASPQRPIRATREIAALIPGWTGQHPVIDLHTAHLIVAWDRYQDRLRQRFYVSARPEGEVMRYAAD